MRDAPAPRTTPVPAPGRLAAPAPGVVQVWWIGTAVPDAQLEALRADLDAETATRLAQLAREQDRRRGIVAHGLLRRLCAARTGMPPSAVRFTLHCVACGATDHGKPELATGDGAPPPFRVNLSHSGELVAVALAGPDTPVGVDVEAVREGFDWGQIRRQALSDAEWAATAAEPDPSRARYAAWTRKEAAVKATGHGLAVDLSEVLPGPPAGPDGWRATAMPVDVGDVLVADLALEDRHEASVAVVVGSDAAAPRVQLLMARL